jgi:hypothetical protein
MPERITLSCPACSHSWPAAATAVGEPAPCPACGEVVRPRRAAADRPDTTVATCRRRVPAWLPLVAAAVGLAAGLAVGLATGGKEADTSAARRRWQADWDVHPEALLWYETAKPLRAWPLHKDHVERVNRIAMPDGTVHRGEMARLAIAGMMTDIPAGTRIAVVALHTAADGATWYLLATPAPGPLPLRDDDDPYCFGWVSDSHSPWGCDPGHDVIRPEITSQIPRSDARRLHELYYELALPLIAP